MKKIIAITMGLIMSAMMLSACNQQDKSSVSSTSIYCINADKTGIETQKYKITESDPKKEAEKMIKEMSKSATEVNYNPAIPEGVKVLSCTLNNSHVILNLSEGYEKISDIEQVLLRAAVVDSLVQIEGISGVEFQVEGRVMTDRDGNEIGLLDANSFVQNVGSTLNTYQTATLHLFFSNEEGDALHMESKDVKYNSNISLEKLIMDQLLRGPAEVGDYQTLNPDTTILGVTIRDDICYVNLDDIILQNGLDVKPEIVIYSIVNSLIDGTDVTSVQISINGENNVKYMEQVDLSKPLQENTGYVEVK